jgi:hypothetical protein
VADAAGAVGLSGRMPALSAGSGGQIEELPMYELDVAVMHAGCSNRETCIGDQQSRPAGAQRMLLHQRGPGDPELGDDATVGTGPIAWD